jgi:hypothetical protein
MVAAMAGATFGTVVAMVATVAMAGTGATADTLRAATTVDMGERKVRRLLRHPMEKQTPKRSERTPKPSASAR